MSRLLQYLQEEVSDKIDTGSRGKQFEEYFKDALDLIGLQYVANSSSGAVWDIRSVGDEWRKFIDSTNINIKLSGTKWMFGSIELYKNLPWDDIGEDWDENKYIKKVRKILNSKNIPSTFFLKPKSKDIEKGIIKAAKSNDVEALEKLFVKKNFLIEKLGRSYSIRILTRDNRISSIAIDKGGKVFMRSEKPRKLGGSFTVTFRTPTPKLSKSNRSVKS